MEIGQLRRNRRDLVMRDIGARDFDYRQNPNPDMMEVTFSPAEIKDGYVITGTTFFDMRRKWTDAMRHRGFELTMDNQGSVPVILSVRDILPEDYVDGTILGLDNDGCILQWNDEDLEIYNCGETPDEFGEDSITPEEARRIQADAWAMKSRIPESAVEAVHEA